VHERWTQATAVATSLVTLVEARAALARRRHRLDLSPAQYRRGLRQFTDDWDRLVRIEVNERLVTRAADLADAHRLRGHDAIHLASAVLAAERFTEETIFGSWDDALDAAAAREGLQLLRPRRR
jgi:predicted nucleic acid-binding protein